MFLRVVTKTALPKKASVATELLRQAFENVSAERGQDAIARKLIEAIESDARRWEAAFARSLETLDKLAGEALAECRAGRTKPLDPDKL